MEDISEAEKQRRQKYRDHDLVIDDLKPMDIETIRGAAVRGFIETRKSDNVELIVDSFMAFLTSRGYRITQSIWKRELDECKNPINVLYAPCGCEIKREKP